MPTNKQLGWICGYNGKVIKTIDGGANWTGYNVDLGKNPMLESIHFPSVSIGYASGSQGIWKSQDGGAVNRATTIIAPTASKAATVIKETHPIRI